MSDRNISPASWSGASRASRIQMVIVFTGPNDQQTFQLDNEVNSYSITKHEYVSLATGTNTITIPANASGVFIVPPATNTLALSVKAVAGDSNAVTFKTGIHKYPFDPASLAANFVINNGGGVTLVGVELYWY